MDEGMAVALAAIVAVLAQSVFLLIELRRGRAEREAVTTASARLVRDQISGDMEALHQAITRREWWTAELDCEQTLEEDDRRRLAANVNAETLRRSFGSLRRFRQLRMARQRAINEGGVTLTHDQLVEVVAVFLDLATARRMLAPYTGYGSAPFGRPLDLPPDILHDALDAVGLPSANGLYTPRTTISEPSE